MSAAFYDETLGDAFEHRRTVRVDMGELGFFRAPCTYRRNGWAIAQAMLDVEPPAPPVYVEDIFWVVNVETGRMFASAASDDGDPIAELDHETAIELCRLVSDAGLEMASKDVQQRFIKRWMTERRVRLINGAWSAQHG